jgi:fumarate reductase subunit D
MARSNKPLLWFPFAMGGTIAALLLPALILVMLLPGLGLTHAATPTRTAVLAIAGHWIGAIAFLLILGSLLWHAAHRLRMTLQDLGARSPLMRRIVVWLCYGTASVATVALFLGLGSVVITS